MKIELHLIQSFGPSCLNRDATNSPKDCDFGGVRRARVSSQCFKRSVREYFRAENLAPVGERTKRLRLEVGAFLNDVAEPESVPYAIDAFVDTYYAKNDSKRPEHASVLLFLSRVELEEIARIIEENWGELQPIADARRKKVEEIAAKKAPKSKSKDAQGALDLGAETSGADAATSDVAASGDAKYENLPKPKLNKAIVERLQRAALSSDIALFGRMLAEHPEHRIEAAAQVAHAISTHSVTPELDFFSAVDDLNKDDAGAGMLGVTGFNAAVFYRYALVDFDALLSNLKGDREVALQTARAFLQSFVEAIPSGKQNSMAARSQPSFGFFVVRENGVPCSLVNAFCDPITRYNPETKKHDRSILGGSITELCDYSARFSKVYGDKGVKSKSLFCMEKNPQLGALEAFDKGSVEDAIDAAMKSLGEDAPQS